MARNRIYNLYLFGGNLDKGSPVLATGYGEYEVRKPIAKQIVKDVLRPDDFNVARGVADIVAAIHVAVRRENENYRSQTGHERFSDEDVDEALTLLLEATNKAD